MAGEDTSLHIGRAREGDETSLSWLVERFTPLLMAQADMRLGSATREVEPADLVNDTWAVVMRRLGEIEFAHAGSAPTFVRFLSSTLLNRYRNALKVLARKGLRPAADPWSDLARQTRGVLTRLVHREADGTLVRALGRLDDVDRRILIMRAIEQLDVDTVAMLLDMKPNTVSQRYRRAMERLREVVGPSVLDDLHG